MNLTDENEIPYNSLMFIISIINYGGRIIDNQDSILIEAIISQFINENLLTGKQKLTENINF